MPHPQGYVRPKLTKEEKAQQKIDNDNRRWRSREDKRIKREGIEQRKAVKRELNILKYMLKSDVLYFHHGYSESLKGDIIRKIERIKDNNRYTENDGYGIKPICYLGNVWRGVDGFESIYDIPLDGTYVFQVYDSGQRGLGSFNRITAHKVEVEATVPYVNPGAIIGITAF